MLRRSILLLASRSSVSRIPLRATTQIPSYLSSRRGFSVSQKNEPHKTVPASEPQSQFTKIVTGGLAMGSVLLAAYYYVFFDRYGGNDHQSISEYIKSQISDEETLKSPERHNLYHQPSELNESIDRNTSRAPDVSTTDADHGKKGEINSEPSVPEDSVRNEVNTNYQAQKTSILTPENIDHVEEGDVPIVPQTSLSSHVIGSKPTEKNVEIVSADLEPDEKKNEALEVTPTFSSVDKAPEQIVVNPVQKEQTPDQDTHWEDGPQTSISLLDDYYLRDNVEKATKSSHELKDPYDDFITKDGKLVLDFLQAIHAAEERQAKLDNYSFNEEKRAIKEKYEKELKDARVRELMYAEREAILDKELNKERVKAASALKSLQDRLEEKLKTELEQKEMEIEERLKKMQDMTKAELAAAIASEKASHIEKMAEANLHINALCMAFFARSEEARQNHSVHKLALGALSLEDALSKGLPIQKEIEALHNHIEGIDNDSLINLVLSSLPEDTRRHGTNTLPQLNHKFDTLKGTLRHFGLIPPGGGGILAHSLAYVASWLKVKKVDESGDGIESLINRVEHLLAQGKLCEAADTLENGVKGSEAAEVIVDWVRQARNRAITEQASTVLQSYATSISLT